MRVSAMKRNKQNKGDSKVKMVIAIYMGWIYAETWKKWRIKNHDILLEKCSGQKEPQVQRPEYS